jgi:sodium-coupled neutral amino acid transporter 7/8
LIAVIPVICFAYQCHEIVVPVYASMKHRDVRSFTKTTIMSLIILFVLYSMAGSSAYHTFGRHVTPDIMQLYNAKQPIVMFGTVALAVKMISTYPPMVFCGRGALDGLYSEWFQLSVEQVIEGERKRRMVITSGWFVSSLLLAIYTPSIGIVIELLGSLASANVFIFPSFCLIVIAKRHFAESRRYVRNAIYAISVLMIVFGTLVFLLVLTEIGTQIIHGRPNDIVRNVTVCQH